VGASGEQEMHTSCYLRKNPDPTAIEH